MTDGEDGPPTDDPLREQLEWQAEHDQRLRTLLDDHDHLAAGLDTVTDTLKPQIRVALFLARVRATQNGIDDARRALLHARTLLADAEHVDMLPDAEAGRAYRRQQSEKGSRGAAERWSGDARSVIASQIEALAAMRDALRDFYDPRDLSSDPPRSPAVAALRHGRAIRQALDIVLHMALRRATHRHRTYRRAHACETYATFHTPRALVARRNGVARKPIDRGRLPPGRQDTTGTRRPFRSVPACVASREALWRKRANDLAMGPLRHAGGRARDSESRHRDTAAR